MPLFFGFLGVNCGLYGHSGQSSLVHRAASLIEPPQQYTHFLTITRRSVSLSLVTRIPACLMLKKEPNRFTVDFPLPLQMVLSESACNVEAPSRANLKTPCFCPLKGLVPILQKRRIRKVEIPAFFGKSVRRVSLNASVLHTLPDKLFPVHFAHAVFLPLRFYIAVARQTGCDPVTSGANPGALSELLPHKDRVP